MENIELLAHVASFHTQRELLDYRMDVVKVLPLEDRGDYLLFVQENNDLTGADMPMHFYSAWSPSGEMPFTVVDGEPANVLPAVIPMAVSPDGATFVGLRISTPEPYFFVIESTVVVDLATAEILYEYPLPVDFTYFNPPSQANGVDIVWPGE